MESSGPAIELARAPEAHSGALAQAPQAGSVHPEMSSAAHILICDHRGGGAGDALAVLAEQGFTLEVSTGLRRSLQALQARRPDAIVLLALSRPGAVELAALETARARGVSKDVPHVPILVLAAPDDPDAVLRANRHLGAGPWDVAPERISPDEIGLRLRRLIDRAAQEAEMAELRHRASHDDRTDLLRPNSFEKRLAEHFAAASRHHYELALVLIDLDRFGSINKDHDHTVGDRLITAVGEVIRKALRVEDAAGRLGGDEFAVILPFTRKIDAAGVVKRLAEEIKALSGTPPGAREHIDVGASIGFETFDGTDIDSVKTLRRHAERALRVAKESGGNQGVYYRNLDA